MCYLRAKIRDLKGQLKTNKGLKNNKLNRKIVDLMADKYKRCKKRR